MYCFTFNFKIVIHHGYFFCCCYLYLHKLTWGYRVFQFRNVSVWSVYSLSSLKKTLWEYCVLMISSLLFLSWFTTCTYPVVERLFDCITCFALFILLAGSAANICKYTWVILSLCTLLSAFQSVVLFLSLCIFKLYLFPPALRVPLCVWLHLLCQPGCGCSHHRSPQVPTGL